MLRGKNPSLGLASEHPQLLEPMPSLPPHMVWTGLGTIIAGRYIKLVLISGKHVVEGAPIAMEHLLCKVGLWGCQLRISLYKAVIIVGKPQE